MKVNYLNNKDLLDEIHKSKNTYCKFIDPLYHQYDIILPSIDKINIRTIADSKRSKAKRLSSQAYERRKSAGEKVKQAECEVDYKKITKQELIFRVMTYDHVPLNNIRKKNPKTLADHRDKVNFPPFQHFKFNEQGILTCVGKSHWKGDLETGHFDRDHGQITNTLARMYIKLCERYATRGNVRGYTYNDEMKGQAILQLTQIGIKFDESKSNNPFAYFTAAVTNSFVKIINLEKRNQNIRDDLLEINGMNPSYTRTSNSDHANAIKRFDEETLEAADANPELLEQSTEDITTVELEEQEQEQEEQE
jgi:hypothetical protein